MGKREIIDVNAPWVASGALGGEGDTAFVRTVRETKKGTKRKNFRLDIKSDAMLVNTDAREANRAFGSQLQKILATQIENVRATASKATVERRRRAYRDGNSRSYRKHYAGGRTGETRPSNLSTRLLNDSGRLKLTTVRPRRSSSDQSTATINFTANRLHPDIVGDFGRIMQTLRAHVPMMAGKADPKTQGSLVDALEELMANSVATSEEQMRKARAELRQLQLQVAKDLINLATG